MLDLAGHEVVQQAFRVALVNRASRYRAGLVEAFALAVQRLQGESLVDHIVDAQVREREAQRQYKALQRLRQALIEGSRGLSPVEQGLVRCFCARITKRKDRKLQFL